MAGKNVKGQLDMFELFGSVEELEENVKGTPELLPEAPGHPVMLRCFTSKEKENTAVVAYLDYNRVYIKDWDREPVIYQFESSKEAVDFYVDRMERYQSGKQVRIKKEAEALKRASVIKWTGEGEAE